MMRLIFLNLLLTSLNHSFLATKIEDEFKEFKDPCALKKCSPEEICVAKDDNSASCIKRNYVDDQTSFDITRMKRDVQSNGFCGTKECRFGECEIYNSTSFICHCSKGVTGPSCNILDSTGLPCMANPCYGDSVCINLGNSYVCVCEAGRAGPQCRDHASPCQCKNGGICIQKVSGLFRCECPIGFGGHLCQYMTSQYDSCELTGCLNGGVCNIYNKCQCHSSFTGSRCEISFVSPSTKPINVKSRPPKIIPFSELNVNICSDDACQNGGTCTQLGPNSAICLCKKGYSGPYCNFEPLSTTPVTTTSTTTSTTTTKAPATSSPPPLTLPCPKNVPNPCLNNGFCLFSNVTKSISCSCSPTYTGTFCSERVAFCSTNPCLNGASCNQLDEFNGNCTCATGYTGFVCDISLTCKPNPCKNFQPCLVINGSARCFCSAPYSPPFCE